jgi:hypothetical protein
MDDAQAQSTNSDPRLDEAVWNAWVKKDETRDKIRFARRKTVFGIILVLGVVALFVWGFTR